MRKNIAIILAICGAVLLLAFAYMNSQYRTQPQVFSTYTVLISSWEKYKQKFVQADGRVIDFSQNDMTTSEGQSYALLRAVWTDDKATFDTVWTWTKNNLKRDEDALYGWKWGKRQDGEYGFLENGGENSATDADSDIALALIFASERWRNDDYKKEALTILEDMWKYTTAEANGKRYLLAGRWANSNTEIIVNPSYFSPYAWRVFANYDSNHNWLSLIDPSYELLTESGKTTFNDQQGVGLPPDWVAIDKSNGSIKQPPAAELKTSYSYDAMRVPWRIALDYQWFKEPQALAYLQSLSILSEKYKADGKLFSSYNHDGTPMTDYENPSMYSTALGYYTVVDPALAQEIYNSKILSLYSSDNYTFKEDLPYYDQNWLWFGVGLYNEDLPLLAKGKQ